MKFFEKKAKILGINARNLQYLSKYNSRSDKKFADDKIFTKHFLASRGLGVAKLFHAIKSQRELTSKFLDALPESFVVKPSRGYGGGGILVIERRRGANFLSISGDSISRESLFQHCVGILEGRYSISGVSDQVIFEERLLCHPDFRVLSETGLPDVRVIVFQNVPVMAMARIPTLESEGKANMEMGAVALGIDIGSGKTTGGAHFSKFLKRMPNGESTIGFQIPFWDEILDTCTRTQMITKIGFLGVDLVVDGNGVKILEINARPGLKIQVANRAPLRDRLQKVADLKILDPADGVEVAKTLFSEKSVPDAGFVKKPTIGTLELVTLNAHPPKYLRAKVDLSATENVISPPFFASEKKVYNLTIGGVRMKLPAKKGRVNDADLILAGKYLGDFYVDPSKKWDEKRVEMLTADLDEKKLKSLDEKVCEIDRQIRLLAFINPQNLESQHELFRTHPGYEPQFSYRKSDLDFTFLHAELKKLPQIDHLLTPLYQQKITELQQKLHLLESVDSADFPRCSGKVFGSVSSGAYQRALKFVQNHQKKIRPDTSEIWDAERSESELKKYLKQHHLGHWKIKILTDSVADIQVVKKGQIFLKKDAKFSQNRLQALLAHEVGTHVFRFENGKRQDLQLFARGTAGYLQTEEGLAIWNQNALGLNLGEKFLMPAYLIIGIYWGQKMNFNDLFGYLKTHFELDDADAWKITTKVKRGVKNGEKGAFTKDALYFLGHEQVEDFFKKSGHISELYPGKISIRDLKILKKYDRLKPGKWLP